MREEKRHDLEVGVMPQTDPTRSLPDGGSRVNYKTGAIREGQEGRGRFDLISPIGLARLGKHYELGAKKYADRNWENGMPASHCINSIFRHLIKYLNGGYGEDHLAAIAWNAFAIMHYEEKLPKMIDIPNR